MKSTNKNFIYNVLYQVLTFIIPLIVTPYISRVLGANNIGIYSYSYSIVYYFMLITLLGINNHGSRSIAKLSKDKEKMSEKFWSIYYLQLTLGILMLIIYNFFVTFFIKENKTIFYLQNFFLLSAITDINWFYFGIEKFKLTISRNLLIKLLSIILIFIFVKNANDLWKYTFIMSICTLISQMYLWLFLRKNISYIKVSLKDILKNLKPCFILFIPVISYSIYRVMDKTMLGSISGTIALGYYENAEKIINIPISFITALGTVMLPHMSKINKDDKEELNKKIYESYELCFVFVIPMIFGLLAISKDFSLLFFGEDFVKSGNIIILLLPTILFGSIANVMRTNYLIPQKKDNIYVKSTIFGAIVNLILNTLLIPKYSYYGACIGTIAAEFLLMFYQIINVRKEINIKKIIALLIKYIGKGLIMFIIIFLIGLLFDNIILKMIVQITFAVIIYFMLNYKYIIYDFLAIKSKKK